MSLCTHLLSVTIYQNQEMELVTMSRQCWALDLDQPLKRACVFSEKKGLHKKGNEYISKLRILPVFMCLSGYDWTGVKFKIVYTVISLTQLEMAICTVCCTSLLQYIQLLKAFTFAIWNTWCQVACCWEKSHRTQERRHVTIEFCFERLASKLAWTVNRKRKERNSSHK